MQELSAVNSYLQLHENDLLQKDIEDLRNKLLNCSESKWNSVRILTLKEPVMVFGVSFFCGIWGVDRFILDKKGSGVLKLFTCQLCIFAGIASFFLLIDPETYDWGMFCLIWFIIAIIWEVYDWCFILKWTKEYNYKKIINILNI